MVIIKIIIIIVIFYHLGGAVVMPDGVVCQGSKNTYLQISFFEKECLRLVSKKSFNVKIISTFHQSVAGKLLVIHTLTSTQHVQGWSQTAH